MRCLLFFVFIASSLGANCNSNDLALWKDNYEFTKAFEKIAKKSMGSKSTAFALFREKYPQMTESCCHCHSELVGCGAHHCMEKCFDSPKSFPCRQCIRANCIHKYSTCLGYNGVDMPLEP